MDIRKLGSGVKGADRRSLKGFTLIEMIVVITIIAVLAGISSIIINGFQRDARIETDNNRAQMLYTGFQDVLIECEINQDVTIFNDGTVSAPDTVDYAVVKFDIDSTQTDNAGRIVNVELVSNNTTGLTSQTAAESEKLRKAAAEQMSFTFDGTVYAYINVKDYTVDSICYFENSSTADISKANEYRNFADHTAQKNLADSKGLYVGLYPVQSDLSL